MILLKKNNDKVFNDQKEKVIIMKLIMRKKYLQNMSMKTMTKIIIRITIFIKFIFSASIATKRENESDKQ